MRERNEIEQDRKIPILGKQLELLFDIRDLLQKKEKPESETERILREAMG